MLIGLGRMGLDLPDLHAGMNTIVPDATGNTVLPSQVNTCMNGTDVITGRPCDTSPTSGCDPTLYAITGQCHPPAGASVPAPTPDTPLQTAVGLAAAGGLVYALIHGGIGL